ncbi:hypothetical protein B0H14DRAFT_3156589 [Mycena olivaceomarginata]|nr:hypothetical protein B0H14DRAFT_3156589 [Mycena olivaceomarginata]
MDLVEEAMHSRGPASISRYSALLVRNFFPRPPRSNRNSIHRTPDFIAIADEGLLIMRAQLRLPPGGPGFSITPLDLAESPFFRPYLKSAVRNFAGGLELTPSEKLIWTPCYSGFECSRLIVPLDYALAATGTAAIAVTRYPSSSKSDYRGPVLLNPGGPEGSGVNYVVEAGPSISTILGSDFDIIGFDPRVSFFKTDAERALWVPAYVNPPYPSPNASSGMLAETRAKGQILGTLAQNRNDNYEYMTTDNTARDMLRITEAFGFRYGSVLGSTFAALFPANYIHGVLSSMASLESVQPLQVFTPISYGVLGYTLLRNFVYNALADPYNLFPFLGQSLADLANGNVSTMYSASVLPPFECPVYNLTTPALPFHENSFEAAVAIYCGDGIPISSSLEELQEFYEGVQEVTKNFAEFALYFRTLCK